MQLAVAQNAANLAANFFAKAPFDSYRRYFNVHPVDVASAQSGADHPETGIFVDTAFDATHNCAGTPRAVQPALLVYESGGL